MAPLVRGAVAAAIAVLAASKLTFSAVYRPYGVPFTAAHETWFKGNAAVVAVQALLAEGTVLKGPDAAAADATCGVGYTLVQFVTGIPDSPKSPNAAMLNDMPLTYFDFCNYQPNVVRRRVLHPGVIIALMLSKELAAPATEKSAGAPEPYATTWYRLSEKEAKAILALQDSAIAKCNGDDSGYCSERVAKPSELATVTLEDAKGLVPKDRWDEAVASNFRFARNGMRGSQQQTLSAAAAGADALVVEVEAGADTSLVRPAWVDPDPNFDHWEVRFPCLGFVMWRVDMRPFANCYAYATETSYYNGRVNRRDCRPGRAGGAVLAAGFDNDVGNAWGMPVGLPRNWLNLAGRLNGFPGAGSLVVAAIPAVCGPLLLAVQADGLLAAGHLVHAANLYNAVRVYAHYVVYVRPLRENGVFGPPANSFYHVVCANNDLRQVAQGAPLPLNCLAVTLAHHLTDYHFHRRNDDAGNGDQQWSDKNGDQRVHGTEVTANDNDDDWQRNAYAGIHAAVAAEIARGNDRAVGYLTLESTYCGERFALAHQVASGARGGPNAGDCVP